MAGVEDRTMPDIEDDADCVMLGRTCWIRVGKADIRIAVDQDGSVSVKVFSHATEDYESVRCITVLGDELWSDPESGDQPEA